MPRKKFDEIAKDILNWLTDKGVDLTSFTAKEMTIGTKWTAVKLLKLSGLALRESLKLGGGAHKELKSFIASRKKEHRIEDSETTID